MRKILLVLWVIIIISWVIYLFLINYLSNNIDLSNDGVGPGYEQILEKK